MDYDEWQALTEEFQFFRLVHDEVDYSDLLLIVPEAEVEWCWRAQKSVKGDWNDAPLRNPFEAFTSEDPFPGINFDRCDEIIRARFQPKDRIIVDFEYRGGGTDRYIT